MNRGEVFIPAKPLYQTFDKPILEKYLPLAEGYKPRDKVVLTLALRNGEVVILDDGGSVLTRVVDDMLRGKQVCGRQDLLSFAYRRAERIKQSDGVDCDVVEEDGVVKVVAHLTAFDAFMDDVRAGLVKDPEDRYSIGDALTPAAPPTHKRLYLSHVF
ncbi:MAG: hypothetical protein QW570_07730 [Candidatus Caldarchaeum sp.]